MIKFEDLKNLTILYADDDEILLESTAKTLSMIFSKVYTAKNGEEAIKIFDEHNTVHITMLDVKMGSVSGIDVAKHIRRNDPNIPIFLVSSYAETKDMIEACKLNLVDYIQKPFTFSILTQTLLDCLARLQANGSLLAKINNNLFYNQFSKELIKENKSITLSKNEIEIFELLLAKGNQIVTYEMLINYLGGEISDAALKNIILRLRKKIGDDTIRNLSKVGYTLLLER